MSNSDDILLLHAEEEHDLHDLPPYVGPSEQSDNQLPPLPPLSGQDDSLLPPPLSGGIHSSSTPIEPPPSYSHSTKEGERTVLACKVCQHLIDISTRRDQHAVKCEKCNELSPVKDPPEGKKYIRCVCNCLLICNKDAARVRCPRSNCNYVTTVNAASAPIFTLSRGIPIVLSGIRYSCGHCQHEFFFNRTNVSVRCSHCQRISSPGPQYAKRRASVYISVGVLFIVIGIILIVSTYFAASQYGGYYTIYIGAFIVGLLNILRGMFFACMKVSYPITQRNRDGGQDDNDGGNTSMA